MKYVQRDNINRITLIGKGRDHCNPPITEPFQVDNSHIGIVMLDAVRGAD